MKGLHRAGCATFTQSEMISFIFFAQNDECLILKCMGHKMKNTTIIFKVLAISVCGFGCKNIIVFKIKKSFTLKNYSQKLFSPPTQSVIHFIRQNILPSTVTFSRRIHINHTISLSFTCFFFFIKIWLHTYLFSDFFHRNKILHIPNTKYYRGQ